MVQKNSIIIISGATASGKTDIAVKIAKLFGGEIISADSVQVYKEFDIGSAKVTSKEMQGIPHYYIDEYFPDEESNVAKFCENANKYIKIIHNKNKIPIITGGTLMYIKALYEGFDFFESEKDNIIRNKYTEIYNKFGAEYLYNILKEKNIEKANKIHCNNINKVIRALEIIENGNAGKLNNKNKLCDNYNVISIFIKNDREILYERINKRVDIMMDQGLLNEVIFLKNKYKNVSALNTIGYKELCDYLDNKISYDESINLIKQHSRNYAKRQITFAKTMPYMLNIEKDNIINKIEEFLKENDK